MVTEPCSLDIYSPITKDNGLVFELLVFQKAAFSFKDHSIWLKIKLYYEHHVLELNALEQVNFYQKIEIHIPGQNSYY